MMSNDQLSELERFHAFVGRQLESSEPPPTPEACLALWREHCEVLEAIREGLAEAEAGLGRPFREVLEEIQANYQAADAQ